MKNLKNNVMVALVIIGLLVFTGCSTDKHNEHNFVVGTCAEFPPYEVLNDHGAPVGFDIDVAQKIADKLGKKLVIKDMSFDALFVSLKQGKIDAILAGLSITKSRCAGMAMVHYHGKPLKSLPLLFWQRIPVGVTTIADLATQSNKTVCTQVGTIQEEIISKYTYLNIKHLESTSDLILEIKHGKSIAAIVEPMVVDALQHQLPEIKVMNLPLKDDEQGLGHGIGMNKNNMKLVAVVEQVVDQLKADGSLTALENKWFTGGCHVAE